MSKLDSLFAPFQSSSLDIPNRIVMAPMTRSMSPGNVPNDQVVEYYRRRAAGGVGLIVTEGTCVDHKAANGYPDVPFFYGEDALAGWKRVVDAVHAEGGKVIPQLWHVGSIRDRGTEPDPEVPGYSPSGRAIPGGRTGHEMTQDDIDEVVAAFAKAAGDAEAMGFDGVEIHGAHGYLVDQFFWETTNQRTDSYGGSLQNRSRFAIEIIEAIRASVGKKFPVVLRWSQWKQQEYTARLVETPEALEAFIKPLSDAGVDIFHCSQRRFWEPEFEGSELNLAGWVKRLTGKPTITVGSVGLDADFLPIHGTTFREAEPTSLDNLLDRLENDEFDLVALGRTLITNPDWPSKIREVGADAIKPYVKEALLTLD